MLELNRIYTPDEIRAMARLAPVDSRHPVGFGPEASGRTGKKGSKSVLAVLVRIVRRGGVRRPAPGTT